MSLLFCQTVEEWSQTIRSGRIPGKYGVIEFSSDGTRVICPLCGKIFKVISRSHIQAHGLANAEEFRQVMGLNRNQSLAAPAHRDLRRKQLKSTGQDQALTGMGQPFQPGSNIAQRKTRREQACIEYRERGNKRRKENCPRKGHVTKDAYTRKLDPDGGFSVFGTHYQFGYSFRNQEVVIQITDSEIIAKLKNNPSVKKTFQRKR